MPKSSRHKSHKHSKRSSRDYSDSEEDVVKMKEKSSKDNGSTRGHRGSVSGEKRKISSQLREGKESKDLSGHGNGDVMEEYVSSKRRKEKDDVSVGGDRWNGDGEEREDRERRVEKEQHKEEILKLDVKLKENSSKGESSRGESKSRSKRHDSGISGERKEDSLISAVVEKEGSKTKGESKRRSERDSSSRKEGKQSKDKDRRSDKEKNGGQESKSGDAEMKLVDMDIGKKQGAQLSDLSGVKQNNRSLENNAEHTSLFELKIPDLDKHTDKKIRKKREGSSEREKYRDEQKESDGRRVLSKCDRANDPKRRDDKHMDGVYPDKYQEDGYKDDKRRDDKYQDEADEGYSKSRDDRHREYGDRDDRHKDEKHRYDGEWDRRRKDDKYHEVIEREAWRENKYHEDGDKDYKRKDDRNHDDGDKDIRRGDERYYEGGDRDDRRRDSSCRDDAVRDYRHTGEKYCDDIERDIRYKDSKQGGASNRENISRDSKYRDERPSRDKYDPKRSRDDTYGADHHVRKSNAYDDNPTRDDQATRYRDDQGRRRTSEKEDYSDVKSRVSKDQKSDAEKKSVSSAKMDPGTDRVRPNSRRWSSPTSSSHAPSDNYRSVKQDDTKYRDYNYEDRSRHNTNPTRDYPAPFGGSNKTSSSRSLDKFGQKDDPHFGETNEENLKSPSVSVDRRQFTQRNIDFDESTQRSAGELVPVNTDPLSVSSPFARNSHHFSSNSKSFPPPPSSFRMDHNMGRMQGNNAWRGVPSWPSPVPNGFLPFPHTTPFHSIMQPFHTPPMFGARPSMELNLNHHHSPYHMPPDANRFSGPGQPMGWNYQVDDSFPPQLHGWDTSTDLGKVPNRTTSLEMKENNSSIRSGDDEALGGDQLVHRNEQTQQFDNVSAVVKSTKRDEKNENRESVYLSKLDISAELAEPELYDKCAGLIDMDKDSEDKMASLGFLSFAPFSSNVDSIFKKSMSLYKIQKEGLVPAYGEKPKVIPSFDQDDINMQEDENEKQSPTYIADKTENLQEKIEGEGDNIKVKSLGNNYAPLLNSDVLSEAYDAMMPESSRIHLSSESTH